MKHQTRIHLIILTAALTLSVTANLQGQSDSSPSASPSLSSKDQAFVESGGRWITDTTVGGHSKEDLSAAMDMAASGDNAALVQMADQGRIVVLHEGQRVHLDDVSIFGGVEKVRPFGGTDSWWIGLGNTSKAPIKHRKSH